MISNNSKPADETAAKSLEDLVKSRSPGTLKRKREGTSEVYWRVGNLDIDPFSISFYPMITEVEDLTGYESREERGDAGGGKKRSWAV
jgi:hypothetical protein